MFIENGRAELTGRDIVEKVNAQQKVGSRVGRSKMVLINKAGKTREREVLQYEKSYKGAKGFDQKMLVFFEFPADIRGTGLLVYTYIDPKKDDDRWLYMPALKKIRRIAGESKNEYFMGTDFTYDDIGGRGVDEDNHKLLGMEEVGGVKCYKVESVPIEPENLYSKRVAWVLPDKWVAIRVDFYEKKGALLKTLTASDVRQVDGIWTPFKLEMNNFSENHKTILEIKEVKYNQPIDENIFTTTILERGKVQ
jgi:outer membrane lipoprotein-sorting protein